MIVHLPQKTIVNGEVTVSARFEMDEPLPNIPEKLWYKFPEKYGPMLNNRADAFAPVALLNAMYAGEDLEIRGEMCPVLADNLLKYRDQFHEWWPEIFKQIDVKFTQLVAPKQVEEDAMVLTTFSGGVDSFYSLWENTRENQPDPASRITHGIFIGGIDLRLEDDEKYQEVLEEYQKLFADLGVELIEAATNAWQFSEFRVNWTKMFGAATISIVHLFSSHLRKFYFPSDVAVRWVDYQHGSSPKTDPLLSSEAVEIVHQGLLPGRGGKIKELVKWPVTHHKLRVCSDKVKMHGLQNCSKCHKCYRTLTWLELENALQYYANFKGRMKLQDYVRWGAFTHLNNLVAQDIRNEAWKRKNYRMAVFTQISMILNVLQKLSVTTIKKVLGPALTYKVKRLIYRPESKEVQ